MLLLPRLLILKRLVQRSSSFPRGFTLIELVMSMMVMGIIAASLGISIGQLVRSTVDSDLHGMATHLARFEMEKVQNMEYSSIVSSSSSNYEGYNYDLVRTVTYAQGNPSDPENLKQIKVGISRAVAGIPMVLVELITYRAKNVN